MSDTSKQDGHCMHPMEGISDAAMFDTQDAVSAAYGDKRKHHGRTLQSVLSIHAAVHTLTTLTMSNRPHTRCEGQWYPEVHRISNSNNILVNASD